MKKIILLCVFTLLAATNVQAENEGIKVHGHWQFDIYNKDGSFDRKVEFENALTSDGGEALAMLLNQDINLSNWSISLGVNSGFLCNQNGSPVTGCGINENGSNLVRSTVGSNFVLTGSVVIDHTNSISIVRTSAISCTEIIPVIGQGCSGIGGHIIFTIKDQLAVYVQAGQTVNVTVTISFS